MRSLIQPTGALAAGLFLTCVPLAGLTEPITPTRDDEVIEQLPSSSADRDEDRRMRKQLAVRPGDAELAVRVAQRQLERARETGDPRFAGLAMAALRPWRDVANAPDDVLLLRATLQQFVHEFDASIASLRQLLARPGGERRAQAWLTLATVLRVQGRYAESDDACRGVAGSGAELFGRGCLAENAALRGDAGTARASFETLAATVGLPAATQGWLLTSLAELEERAGRPSAADAAFRRVRLADPDLYATVAYADFLIAQGRPSEALELLAGQPRSDAVVLRLAIAGTRAAAPGAPRDVAEMRSRIELANERPDAQKAHGREQAMFALHIDRDAGRALQLARGNVELQREPIDILLLAQAARASGDAGAIEEARRLRKSLGLADRRLDALL